MPISIEPLGDHERRHFSCGQPDLDEWFHRRAGQDERRNVARVFVVADEDREVLGFYSLSTFSLTADELPDHIGRRLPRYGAIPAVLIGRLARDIRTRGQGMGELLLADAIARILATSESVTVFAIVVDAKDGAAKAFYESFGFQPFPSRPMRLFLPTATAVEAMARL